MGDIIRPPPGKLCTYLVLSFFTTDISGCLCHNHVWMFGVSSSDLSQVRVPVLYGKVTETCTPSSTYVERRSRDDVQTHRPACSIPRHEVSTQCVRGSQRDRRRPLLYHLRISFLGHCIETAVGTVCGSSSGWDSVWSIAA